MMNTNTESVNSKDIAKLAGVSQATVSRVLSGKGNVSENTRKKVMKIVDAQGYRPNPFAQAMKTNMSGTIGIAVSRITNPIVPEILEALAQKITHTNRRVVVWNTDTEGEGGVVSAMQQKLVDGMIFTAASHQTDAMKIALAREVPVVSFNRYLEDANCDQIVSTNKEGANTIARYLVANGRKRIAFVNGPQDRTTLADRELGFRAGLTQLGVDLPAHLYARSEFSQEGFRQIAIDLMNQADAPDAIACGNDIAAIGVLNGLKSIGVSVPDDVWVTGFDGIEMSGWDVIDLTTMRQPLEQMATDAVEALINRIEGRYSNPKLIQYRTEFCPRGSTANRSLVEETQPLEGGH